jgi:four helix bundle protein
LRCCITFWVLVGLRGKKFMKTENLVAEKSYFFASRIIKLNRFLNAKKEFILANQVLRSGTSIAANIEEAIGGCSRKEFVVKISISYKEARETRIWIRLMKDNGIISEREALSLLQDCDELLRILTAILNTAKSSNP